MEFSRNGFKKFFLQPHLNSKRLLFCGQHGEQFLDPLPVHYGRVHFHDCLLDDPRGRELGHPDVDGVGALVVEDDDLPEVSQVWPLTQFFFCFLFMETH